MLELIDLHKRTRSRDLFDMGTAVSLAFNDPPSLKKLLDETSEVDYDSLPAMLKAPKKKRATDG